MHRILANQLSRCLSPEGATDFEALVKLVDLTYDKFDGDRARSERANQLMVAELGEINQAREDMMERLRKERNTLDAALENMAHGLAMFDAAGNLAVSNSQYQTLFGLEAPDGTPYGSIRPVIEAMLAEDAADLPDVEHKLTHGEPLELSLLLKDGRSLASAFQPLAHGGWVEVHRDVTEQRRADERIQFLARHDVLTGLTNRAVFNETIATECERVKRGTTFAVLCIDLDRFKPVNDTLGHPVGDKLLVEVSERLKAAVRSTDSIARLGGDEFAIIQVLAEQPAGARILADRIIETLGRPFEIDGHQIVIGASIGIAISPIDGDTSEMLLRNADLALYRAKADGRHNYKFFAPEMDAVAQDRRSLELDLRRALANGEFELHYQPLLDVKTNTVKACEALIRWNHPVRGRVGPDTFIPLAEDIGLIVEIGDWVLMNACQEASSWPDHISVAVNVSPVQFKSNDLVASVQRALTSSGLEPERLELEITEAVLLQNTDKTLYTLDILKGIGARISMDDFGTGYSSLSYLRKFPFDKLKIDRSFIADITSEDNGRSIVKAVTDLASSLGMCTTAEGVENPEQRSYLESLSCDEIQGYLISRPLPASEVSRLLWQDKKASAAA